VALESVTVAHSCARQRDDDGQAKKAEQHPAQRMGRPTLLLTDKERKRSRERKQRRTFLELFFFSLVEPSTSATLSPLSLPSIGDDEDEDDESSTSLSSSSSVTLALADAAAAIFALEGLLLMSLCVVQAAAADGLIIPNYNQCMPLG